MIYILSIVFVWWAFYFNLQVFPAHGAGSPCGKNLSSALYSTIGEEKATNPALQYNDVMLCGCMCVCMHTHTCTSKEASGANSVFLLTLTYFIKLYMFMMFVCVECVCV